MLRRLLAVATVFVLAVPALAEDGVFKPLVMVKGYVGPIALGPVTWRSGAIRDLTGATGTLTVYRISPVGDGTGGTVLWTKTLTPGTCSDDGGTTTYACMAGSVTAQDTATPGSYYAEAAIVQAGTTDPLLGTVLIKGH